MTNRATAILSSCRILLTPSPARIAALIGILTAAVLTGQTQSSQTTLFQLNGDASEVSGLSNGSVVTPSVGPRGLLTVKGGGWAEFGTVGTGTGVGFQWGGQQNSDTAFYSFNGVGVGNLFDVNTGDVSFLLKSRRSFVSRQVGVVTDRYVFDVYDANQELFTFYTSTYGGNLLFNYRTGSGRTTTFIVPAGQENTLFGTGVVVKVRLAWDGVQNFLYLNDVLVQTGRSKPTLPNWTTKSWFLIGAMAAPWDLPGYYSCDDWISQFRLPRNSPPTKAPSPPPANGPTHNIVTPTLSSAASSGATQYDVYFGTTLPTTPTSANQTATTYTPSGPLSYSTTYRWRVDAKNAAGTVTADAWTLTPPPPPPPPPHHASPSPRDGAPSDAVHTAPPSG